MLLLAALCFWLPWHLKQPGAAQYRILVATDALRGSFFDRSVVVMVEHTGFSAIGFVLNKEPEAPGEKLPLGGPVEKDMYFTLHSRDVRGEDTVDVEGMNLAWTKGEDFAQSLGKKRPAPEEYIIFKGYSGWGLQQLGRELKAERWKVIAFDRNLVFHTPPGQIWDIAVQRPAVE